MARPNSQNNPYTGNLGYVDARVCKHPVGGHIVIYDRKRGFDCDADNRWIVMHEPSSMHISVETKDHAYDLMRGLASGDDCGIDLLEEASRSALADTGASGWE